MIGRHAGGSQGSSESAGEAIQLHPLTAKEENANPPRAEHLNTHSCSPVKDHRSRWRIVWFNGYAHGGKLFEGLH